MTQLARRSRVAQWTIALGLAAVCLGVLGLVFALVIRDWRWAPLVLGLPLVIAPLEGALLTPLYALTGRFRYFSPFLLATRRADGGLDLHVGTLFDYLVALKWRDRGPRAGRIVTAELLRGLLALITAVEQGTIPGSAPIVATTYVVGERTLRRLGFALAPAPAAVRVNLMAAVLSIALRLSFVRGRLALPDLGRIVMARTTAEQLLRHKSELRSTLERLERRAEAQGRE